MLHFITQVSKTNCKNTSCKKYEFGTQLETDIFSYITFDTKIYVSSEKRGIKIKIRFRY